MSHQSINRVLNAINALKAGDPIILTDKEDRENEGDLVYAAEYMTPEKMSFMLQHTSGIVCLAITAEKAKSLTLSPMVTAENNSSHFQTPFSISIEAKDGVTTGVSAKDRVHTIKTAINSTAKPEDLARPGHVFPLIAKPWGVLEREGHTEGSVDLMKIAGLETAAVICELMNSNGTMMKNADLKRFSQKHSLHCVTISDLVVYRRAQETLITKEAESELSLKNLSQFTITLFKDKITQEVATVLHKPFSTNPLVRIHSACFTGDILGSLHCDCQEQLTHSLQEISEHGGMVIYLNQEGRGIGLVNKIKAYALQRQGFDTVEANEMLGFPADTREYHMAIQILKYFKITTLTLLSNNPQKFNALRDSGFQVKKKNIAIVCQKHNREYLMTKKEKFQHEISFG